MDHGFPGQVTSVTVTTENTSVNKTIRYDPSYVKSPPGLLKVVEVFLDLIGFICIVSTPLTYYDSRGSWFNTVAMGGLWMSLICLILYMFHVIEKFNKIPWLKVEFILYSLWCFFYLIASSLAADLGRNIEGAAAAAFFGYCAMIAYGYDAWLKFKLSRSGGLAQDCGGHFLVEQNI